MNRLLSRQRKRPRIRHRTIKGRIGPLNNITIDRGGNIQGAGRWLWGRHGELRDRPAHGASHSPPTIACRKTGLKGPRDRVAILRQCSRNRPLAYDTILDCPPKGPRNSRSLIVVVTPTTAREDQGEHGYSSPSAPSVHMRSSLENV
jgi:hypothetical protein